MTSRLILTVLLAAAMSACSPAAVTPNPTAENATALANANIGLTETRAAETPRPTSTRVMFGTATPLGTMPFGTILPDDATATAAAAGTALPVTGATATSSGGLPGYVGGTAIPTGAGFGTPLPLTPSVSNIDPACNRRLDMQAAGPRVALIVTNSADFPLSLTIGFSSKNSFGECGYLYWDRVNAGDRIVLDVPESHPELGDACYWVNALIRSKPSQQWLSEGGFCLTGGQRWVVDINMERIRLTPK